MKKSADSIHNRIVRIFRRLLISQRSKRLSIARTMTGAAIAAVLVVSPGGQANASGGPAYDMTQTPAPSKVSLAMPVFAPLSISEGMDAAVVADIQTRLAALDYLDADQPGTVYEETTKVAVQHFQKQHGLDTTGTVDQRTYDLLMSDQAQYYTIALDAEGPDVSEVQQRLFELGYIGEVTGHFDTETETAVAKFQRLNGLAESGTVDRDTREKLYAQDAAPHMYSYGEQSPEIQTYQQRLKELGYLTTVPDGNFGEDTKAAVRRFQESNGLVVDGNLGPTTVAALMSDEAQGNALAIGAQGDDVTNVQKRLKALGYMSQVTGYYGELTDAAVRSFQKTNELAVDGKVGRQTMNTLTSSAAKKYQAPPASRGTSTVGSTANITGANVESFIAVAESKLGCKYVRCAKGPDSFDCSGFVYWCLNQVGVNQGYMTSGTWATCTKYTRIGNMGDMRRGDIIVFHGHVAIYAGSGTVIDASSSNGRVVKRGCTSSWFSRNFICAYRVF